MRMLLGTTVVECHNYESDNIEFVQLYVKWRYYYSAATHDEPEDVEFEVVSSEVIQINGRPLLRGEEIEVPDWIDWDEVTLKVFDKEGL